MEKSLNECPQFGPFEKSLNIDPPPTNCPDCPETSTPTQTDVAFLDDARNRKTGLGFADQCDPMQTGQITQDMSKAPNRDTIYRYSRAVRGCDEAVMDLFRDLVVIDEQAVAHPVPLMWGTQERAVSAVIQSNVRKDNSNVVDRVRLPLMAIISNSFAFNPERYTYHKALNYFRKKDGRPGLTISERKDRDTVLGLARGLPVDIGYQLTAWTLYVEDMNQILEQVMLKFSPIAYIRVQGVQWESIVKLESIGTNIDTDPGDQVLRVVKFQFDLKAETYIPQPITRKKAVLQERVQIANSTEEDKIVEILSRLEMGAEEGI